MGFKLKNDAEAYSFPNFVKEMFFDSETSMVVISGVPGKENSSGTPTARSSEGRARGSGGSPAELGDVAAQEGDQRPGRLAARPLPGQLRPEPLLGQDRPTPSTSRPLFEQMEREVKIYGIDSWKWYCHTDPGRSGNGFQLDDENGRRRSTRSRASSA